LWYVKDHLASVDFRSIDIRQSFSHKPTAICISILQLRWPLFYTVLLQDC